MVGGLVWGIGLRRLGCVCGRRLGTDKCVSVRQTTTLVVLGLGRAFLCLSVCLSVVYVRVQCLRFSVCLSVCLVV